MQQGQENEQARKNPYPGDVLVAATGFIVTAAGWMLFGFLKGELTFSSSASLFFLIAAAHLISGVLMYRRLSIAVPVAGAVGLIGLAVAAYDVQFVLIFTNSVILLLLFLARGNIAVQRDVT